MALSFENIVYFNLLYNHNAFSITSSSCPLPQNRNWCDFKLTIFVQDIQSLTFPLHTVDFILLYNIFGGSWTATGLGMCYISSVLKAMFYSIVWIQRITTTCK